ncbi:TetR/AcrR family transcriptional regulator [Novosphingobium chloroacetimidivorans]|uniref:TetR/AcrR family transcriptional regulator n=1 Tax=Novosphingobium chloroacetimidivorans TaxID=1428314 RepID=UPI0028B02172|nr:TetR/AcrR family transcriptional regulator [Novosphingobium chloroacetimidivorans]
MTSKREQNKLRRRASIVEIATRSFLERGYAATSMSAIADELGGSKATLWSHFASKEELFTAVVDDLVARLSIEIEEDLIHDSFSIEGLRRYVLRYLKKLMSDQAIALFRLMIAEGGRFPEIVAVFHARAPGKMHTAAVTFFSTCFKMDEAVKLARLTSAALAGYRSMALTRPLMPDEAEIEGFVDDFIAHLRLPAYRDAQEGSL